jgi:hypothetical protein
VAQVVLTVEALLHSLLYQTSSCSKVLKYSFIFKTKGETCQAQRQKEKEGKRQKIKIEGNASSPRNKILQTLSLRVSERIPMTKKTTSSFHQINK